MAQTLTTAFVLTVVPSPVQALIVPGTGTPDPQPDYIGDVVDYYLVPGGDCPIDAPGQCKTTGIKYFAMFWPIPLPGWGGLEGEKWNVSVADGLAHLNDAYDVATATNDDIVIFGYSQGATVATNFKREHATDPYALKARTDYFFIGNPQRPAGGLFERFVFSAMFQSSTRNSAIPHRPILALMRAAHCGPVPPTSRCNTTAWSTSRSGSSTLSPS